MRSLVKSVNSHRPAILVPKLQVSPEHACSNDFLTPEAAGIKLFSSRMLAFSPLLTCMSRELIKQQLRCTQVFWAVGKGWAVRCLDDLPPGTFVCEYVGEILTTNELHERNQALGTEKKHFPVELNACPVTEDYIDDKTGLCLDATKLGNVARLGTHVKPSGADVNHSREPGLCLDATESGNIARSGTHV